MLYSPADPHFANVVRVRWDGTRVQVENGVLSADEASDILQILGPSVGVAQGPYGVFTTELDVQLISPGDAVPEEDSAMVDLADVVDGAMSLHDVRTRLERLCRRLELAESARWQVSSPATRGAFIARK